MVQSLVIAHWLTLKALIVFFLQLAVLAPKFEQLEMSHGEGRYPMALSIGLVAIGTLLVGEQAILTVVLVAFLAMHRTLHYVFCLVVALASLFAAHKHLSPLQILLHSLLPILLHPPRHHYHTSQQHIVFRNVAVTLFHRLVGLRSLILLWRLEL